MFLLSELLVARSCITIARVPKSSGLFMWLLKALHTYIVSGFGSSHEYVSYCIETRFYKLSVSKKSDTACDESITYTKQL